jgi:AcrR family transcriptional regulator
VARPIAKDHREKRSAILKQAAIYFADHGYDRASVNGVASACGISKSLIYHYYDSKEQLLFDILHSHLTALYEGLIALQPAADPEVQLRQLVRKLLQMYRGADAEHRLQLQSTTALPKAQRHILADIQRSIVNEFSQAICAAAPEYLGQDSDHLRPLTMSLFGMVNWFYLWHQPGRGMSRESYADLATEILLGGLTRTQKQGQSL